MEITYCNPEFVSEIRVVGTTTYPYYYFVEAQAEIKTFFGRIVLKSATPSGWTSGRGMPMPLEVLLQNDKHLYFENGAFYAKAKVQLTLKNKSYYLNYYRTNEEALNFAEDFIKENNLKLVVIKTS